MKRKIYYNENASGDPNAEPQGPDSVTLSAFALPEGEFVPPAPAAVEPPPPSITDAAPTPPAPAPVAPVTTEYKYNPIWDEFATKYSTEERKFELPEEVKTGQFGENVSEIDFFLNKALEHIDPASKIVESLPPLAKDYLYNSNKEGFNEREWLESKMQQRSIVDMPDDKLMTNYFKEFNGKNDQRPNGWTDEQIEAKVKALDAAGLLDVQAMQLKQQYLAEQQAQESKRMTELQAQEAQKFQEFVQEQKKVAQTTVEKNQNLKEYFGIPFSEAEKKQFDQDFLKMVEVNPQTGQHKLHEYLLSDDNLYKLAAVIWKGDQGIKSYLSNVKEDIKQSVLDKTGLNPKVSTGATNYMPEKPDLEKWKTPEGQSY